jgi:hypothetical protein
MKSNFDHPQSDDFFPLDRGQVISAGNALFWLCAFIEVYAAPIALDRATGAKIFIWFCVGGAFVLTVVIWLAKETKGTRTVIYETEYNTELKFHRTFS